MRGDLIATERALALLLDMAGRVGATIWRLLGRCIEGKLLIERGDYLAGTRHLRTTIMRACSGTYLPPIKTRARNRTVSER
jgi:hypothetical protein